MYQIKDSEMGEVCGTHGGEERDMQRVGGKT